MPDEEDEGAERKSKDERGAGAGKKSDRRGESEGDVSGGRNEKSVEVAAVVDRIEDNEVAVLSLGDGKRMLDLPLSRLPEGTGDGDHLRLTFDGEPSEKTFARAVRDDRARADAGERVRKLQERLSERGGAQGKKDFKL